MSEGFGALHRCAQVHGDVLVIGAFLGLQALHPHIAVLFHARDIALLEIAEWAGSIERSVTHLSGE